VAEPPQDWKPYLGRKISIRFRLHDDPEHPFSEAVGVVASVGDDELMLTKRTGESVVVSTSDILAAKVFPKM
jgi:ribosome maturation factor RimP